MMRTSRFQVVFSVVGLAFLLGCSTGSQRIPSSSPQAGDAPVPLLQQGHPVEWWFAFKFNSEFFPGCAGGATRTCPFGGVPQPYRSFGQQFIYASNEVPTLTQEPTGCIGDSLNDPVGATFN